MSKYHPFHVVKKSSKIPAILAALILLTCTSLMIMLNIGRKQQINVIFMISDGFGPASETFARNYYQIKNKLPNNTMLPLDTILIGSSRTRSGSSLVTDRFIMINY